MTPCRLAVVTGPSGKATEIRFHLSMKREDAFSVSRSREPRFHTKGQYSLHCCPYFIGSLRAPAQSSLSI
jgi:hypothetical protein